MSQVVTHNAYNSQPGYHTIPNAMEHNRESLRRSTRLRGKIPNSSDQNEFRSSSKNLQEEGRVTRSRQYYVGVSDVDTSKDQGIMMRELGEELEYIEEKMQKPSELFHDNISGAHIYTFRTPSKSNAMVQKALSSRSPTISASVATSGYKTPYVLAERIDAKSNRMPKLRKSIGIQKTRKRHVHFSSESESVSGGSEFMPSDNSESDSETGNEQECIVDHKNKQYDTLANCSRDFQKHRIQIPITPCRRDRSRNNTAYRDYHFKTDEYFETRAERTWTSDHTLGQLKNPLLDEKKLQKLLNRKDYISSEHKECIHSLTESHKLAFTMWYHIMEEGYSILLHGLGSKRHLMDDFYRDIISDHPTLVINGFFPSLTIKDILEGIIVELLELDCPTNPNECFNVIEDILIKNPDARLYLLIHNIDGTMLRSNRSQDMLSRLAAIPNTRVLASVDHINAPLIWDNVKHSRYNFCWWDATTLLPYEAETSYESSFLIQRNGGLALSSLHNVFASLTTNAKSIYTILVRYQLENGNNNLYPGMAFKDLYRGSREAFLVSSDIALRTQLTEFIDHKLMRTKRNVDGAEYLIIPLDNSLLHKFIGEQEAT